MSELGSLVDQWWPHLGPCLLCGLPGQDARHRTIDAVAAAVTAGDAPEHVAHEYGVPLTAVAVAVLDFIAALTVTEAEQPVTDDVRQPDPLKECVLELADACLAELDRRQKLHSFASLPLLHWMRSQVKLLQWLADATEYGNVSIDHLEQLKQAFAPPEKNE